MPRAPDRVDARDRQSYGPRPMRESVALRVLTIVVVILAALYIRGGG
jgi:hypothetical protein